MQREMKLQYNADNDLLSGEVAGSGAAVRTLSSGDVELALTASEMIAAMSITAFSTFSSYEVLYAFGGRELVRQVSQFQLALESGDQNSELAVLSFDTPTPRQRANRWDALVGTGTPYTSSAPA